MSDEELRIIDAARALDDARAFEVIHYFRCGWNTAQPCDCGVVEFFALIDAVRRYEDKLKAKP